ncbi:type II secretion system protein [Vibrio intestinalis]|uniref:type II secretion system protein n=1 Tax=Vibrio intestinalis TaxID=2933291 RepID=UPI002432CC3C|nr:type II secretion system protein [Vibrio intestinalis]
MKKNKHFGFSLIELVVVIAILGVLAITALPQFLNLQDEANEASADAVFSSFQDSVTLYHSKWLVSGESMVDGIEYDDVIYPSTLGYPITGRQRTQDFDQFYAADCKDLWNNLVNTSLGSDIGLKDGSEIIAWGKNDDHCYYHYVRGYGEGDSVPSLKYFPVVGEFEQTRISYSDI